jgi:hypothetical protein
MTNRDYPVQVRRMIPPDQRPPFVTPSAFDVTGDNRFATGGWRCAGERRRPVPRCGRTTCGNAPIV